MGIGSIINIVILAIFLLSILMGVLFGFSRGMRKALHRVIWLVAIVVLLLIFLPMLTKTVLNMDVSGLNLSVNGTNATTISQFIEMQIAQSPEMQDMIAQNPDFVTSMLQMVTLVINSILFFILFWIFKIFTWPLYVIVAAIAKPKKEKEFKRAKKQIKKIKKSIKRNRRKSIDNSNQLVLLSEKKNIVNSFSKRRGIGVLIGLLTAIVIMTVTFSPFIGVASIMTNINETIIVDVPVEDESSNNNVTPLNIIIDEDNKEITLLSNEEPLTEKVGILEAYGGETITEILDALNNSVGAKVLTFTGIKFLSNGTFKILTTTKINGNKLSLSKEVANFSAVAGNILKYSTINFENMTQAELNQLISDAKTIVNSLFDSGIVKVAGNYLIPYFLNSFADNESFKPTGDESIDTAIKTALKELAKLEVDSYKHDLLKVINIAEILNDGGFLYPAMKGQLKTPKQYMDKITEQMVNDIVNNILNFTTLSAVLPEALDLGIDKLQESLDIELTKYEGEYSDQVKLEFARVFSSMYGIVKTLNLPENFDDKIEVVDLITESTFTKFGKFLDNIKSLSYLTDTSYTNIMTKIRTEAVNSINSQENIPQELKDCLGQAITSLTSITNWETSFSKIGQLFTTFKTIYKDLSTKEEVKVEDLIGYLDSYGKMLDKLEESGLIGDIEDYVIAALAVVEQELNAIESGEEPIISKDDLEDIIDLMQNNVSNINLYETEFALLKPVILGAYDLIKDIKNIENPEFIQSFGTALNNYNANGKLMNNGTISSLLEVVSPMLTKAIPEELKDIEDVLNTLITNIGNIQDWTDELNSVSVIYTYLKPAIESESPMEYVFETENYITMLGNKFDIDESVLLNDELIKKLLSFISGEFIPSEFTDFYPNAVTDIKANISSLSNPVWQNEFGAFEDIISCVNELDLSQNDLAQCVTLGITLDVVVNKSQIINNQLVVNIVKGLLNEVKEDYTEQMILDVFVDMQTALTTLTVSSWENEFTAIKAMLDFDLDSLNFANGTNFDLLGKTLDSVKGSVLLNKNIINGLLSDIFADIEEENTTGGDVNIVALFNDIETNIASLGNGVANEYETEFTYLAQIINLLDNITIENADEIGVTFDTMRQSLLLKNSGKFALDIVIDALDFSSFTVSDDITQLPTKLKANRDSVLSDNSIQNPYQIMFNDLKDLSDYTNDLLSGEFNVQTYDISSIGVKLDEFKISSILKDDVIKIMAIEILSRINQELTEIPLSQDVQEIVNNKITGLRNNTITDSYDTIFDNIQIEINNLFIV